METNVRKSKVYSYFYGANTVFQQFIIVIGVLLILMSQGATMAKRHQAQNLYEKYEVLQNEVYELQNTYEEVYYDLSETLRNDYYEENSDNWYYGSYSSYEGIEYGEVIEVSSDDKRYEEKNKHNEALAEYREAEEKAIEANQKYEEKAYGDSGLAILFTVLGSIAGLAGFIWVIIKKLSSNINGGEEAVDEEIQIKIEEAKIKALDKLNIVAEQIEKVEPVVLNGISNYDGSNASPVGKIAGLFQRIVKKLIAIETLLLGAIAAVIYSAISTAVAQIGIFFIAVIVMFALAGFVGLKLYKKYETDSYVSPKTIEKLNKFNPNLIIKLGSDDAIRVSLPAITVYMFGDDQLYMYYQYLDIVTGKIFCEGVNEYFYEDIVGITSSQETRKAFKRHGFLNLMLRTVEYLRENITVVSSGCMHSESYIVPVGNSLLDTKFVGMRNLVRQKKNEKDV